MKVTKVLLTLFAALLFGCAAERPADDRLVIVHTNDTHSHIDPLVDDDMGGVARRKAVIDSIRDANPNVLVVDAGDIVQGTLYFHLYKGEVEQQMLNDLGYDIQVLGNHEFDNGVKDLKKMLDNAKPTLLSSNYDFSGSALEGMFRPYVVKQYGRHKVGIMALNLDPQGIIADGNYDGVKYLPWKAVTERTVDILRNREKCDYVIAVTHIGYKGSEENPKLFGDVQVAEQTSGIDLIIGGHSHTKLEPAVRVANAEGDSVTIVQTGKYGRFVGEVTMNLADGSASEKLIPVGSRLDSRRDPKLMAAIEPYRAGIDSLYATTVARLQSSEPLSGRSVAMLNFDADFILARASELTDMKIDGAIGNKGGLRTTWKPGDISEGAAIDMMPFRNRIVVLEIKGSDLIEAFGVMQARGGDAVAGITGVTQINPHNTYRIATIDYLANGGDYMTPLTRAKRVAESPRWAYEDLLLYLKDLRVVVPDNKPRM